jgi:P63C domain
MGECKHADIGDACMDDEPKGRAKGGIARAAALPGPRRSQIAKRAALARWGAKATHKGSFKEEFGIDVDCYVLDDEQKTAVISQRGMGEALGLGQGGSRLPTFIRGGKIADYIGRELREKLENPLVFQGTAVGANPLPTVYGYDVTILIDLCKAIIQARAEGRLLQRQAHIAQQAQIIVSASAKSGIKQLVYALSGYDASREEIVAAFKLYVRSEARDYEREFPNQLYKEWYRLYELAPPERNKPWKFKQLTVEHVWRPLAHSQGRILELTRAQRAKAEERHKRLHQFLSAIGVKALRTHLGQLLGIAQVCETRQDYEKHVSRIFGEQLELDV